MQIVYKGAIARAGAYHYIMDAVRFHEGDKLIDLWGIAIQNGMDFKLYFIGKKLTFHRASQQLPHSLQFTLSFLPLFIFAAFGHYSAAGIQRGRLPRKIHATQ